MTEMRAVVNVMFMCSKKVTIGYDNEEYKDAQDWIDYSEEKIPGIDGDVRQPFDLLKESGFEVDLWDTQIDSVQEVDGNED